jgi:2-keto-4-pentenoate hydratase/2-oxohepta-3-ene-1,7-dioic acid hydratase in catechol pathway
MKLVTFTHQGSNRTGVQLTSGILDLNAADSNIPDDMLALLRGGDAMMDRALAATLAATSIIPMNEVRLQSPVMNPSKILAVGLNFMAHWDEIPNEIKQRNGLKLPEKPMIFNKQATSVTGPFDDVLLPVESIKLDYEAELGVVIGKECRRVAKEDVMDVIAGFTCLNDVTIRDWQHHSPTFTMGKSWDTHCPMGPCLVTKDEIEDMQNLQVKLFVDGEERQNFNTGEMIFDIATQISYLSTAFTLLPGDVIATGTSAGVALFRKGQPWMTEGQKVRMEIESIGAIENTVVKDSGESFIR